MLERLKKSFQRWIKKEKPDRVVYVSCNPSTLARDLAYLNERGYKCHEIQPVDMFPHSVHVENVAWLSKADN